MSDTDNLKRILASQSVKHGDFTLASGRKSTVYVDVRLTTMSPEGMTLIGRLGLAAIQAAAWKADSIGGLTLGADPVAFAISFTSAMTSSPLRAFTVRKAPKNHGAGNLIEGPFHNDDNVVITEDVITTGNSALQAIDAVERAGAKILGVLAVVNRQEGGEEAIRDRGYDVIALTKINDLLA